MKMKVWGGMTFNKGIQVRTIIATPTKKKAMELLDLPSSYFNDYWSETGNDIELATALAKPNTIFVAADTLGKEFREL